MPTSRDQLIGEIFESMGYMRKAFAPKPVSAKPHAPTHAQLGMLYVISRGKAMTTKELAMQFCMTSSAVTQLTDSLVDHRLISRKEDRLDRRKIRLELTEKGRKMLIAARKQRLKALTKVFAPLTVTELKQLKYLQQKLLTAHENA